MKIGIAGPILIDSLKKYLTITDFEQLKLGFGGTAVNNLIIGLLEKGQKVSVYSLDISIDKPIIIEGTNLKIYLGIYRKSGKLRMLDFFHKEIQQIKEFIITDKPDVVNAHWSYEFAIGAIKSKVPTIVTFRDNAWQILKIKKDAYRIVRFLMDKWVKSHAKNIVVNSPYLKQMFHEESKVTIIPNSFNDNLFSFKPKKIPSSTIKIVSILNGWGKIKNPKPALFAFKKIDEIYNEKIEYYLIGPGYEKGGEGYKWAQKHNLLKNVYFWGSLKNNVLLKKLKEYHILLHPAIEESFGNTLVEAMCAGLPVVAGEKAGAVPWVLNYGKNGVLVNVNNSNSIAEGCITLINNKIVYEDLSKKGLIWVQKNFSKKIIVSKYISLYKKTSKNA